MINARSKYGTGAKSMRTERTQVPKFALLAIAMGFAGCTAGPDFKRPAAPEVTGYIATPVAVQTESAPDRKSVV